MEVKKMCSYDESRMKLWADTRTQIPKKGAKGLSSKLKIMGKVQYEQIDYGNIADPTPRAELMEISIKILGIGELFGHVDLFQLKENYAATLRCSSLNAKIYMIDINV